VKGAFVNVAEIRAALKDPGPTYRPMPMWFWNGRIDATDFIKQMDRMLSHGVRAFFIHPMPQEFRTQDFVSGIEGEYLGSEYMDAVKKVVAAAAERDMRVWLYDEGGWPSGPNAGRVVAERPDLRGKVARYNEEGQVEILERGYPVDLLDRETTQLFIKQVHQTYAMAVGNHFGSTILGFFTDEPRFAGRVGGAEIPWTPKLPEEFKARKGYDISLGMAILFGLKASRALDESKRAQVISDFYDVVTSLWRENWWSVLADWCHERSLMLTGHLAGEDSLVSHLTNGADFFRAMEQVDWPGIDVISRQIHPDSDKTTPTDFPKFASSAAHVTSKKRVLSESFAVYGWDLTPDEMRWITNFQFIRGVNALAPMAFYSDTCGARKIGTMSDQFGANPLFGSYKQYADYTGRLGILASVGTPVIETAVYYPIRSLWFQTDSTITNGLQTVSRALLERQIDFDYLGDDACMSATVSDGQISVGDGNYTALIFPPTSVVPIETMRVARDLATQGGIVVFAGEKPRLTCRAGDKAELEAILGELEHLGASFVGIKELDVAMGMLPRTVRLNTANHDIRVSRRTAGGAEILLFVNESTEAEHALRLRLPVDGVTRLYDPEFDTLVDTEITGGTVRFSIAPKSAVALIVGEGDVETDRAPESEKPAQILDVPGPWAARLVIEWVYDDGEIIKRKPSESHPLEGIDLVVWDELFGATTCGTVDYVTTVRLDSTPRKVVLDLGAVGVTAQVVVNGTPIGSRIWEPYRIDVTQAIGPGENTLGVRVTSTLHRLMSSESVVADLKQRGWYNTYAKQVESFKGNPKQAGLLGPVRLMLWD
jgi:hypothetical protein